MDDANKKIDESLNKIIKDDIEKLDAYIKHWSDCENRKENCAKKNLNDKSYDERKQNIPNAIINIRRLIESFMTDHNSKVLKYNLKPILNFSFENDDDDDDDDDIKYRIFNINIYIKKHYVLYSGGLSSITQIYNIITNPDSKYNGNGVVNDVIRKVIHQLIKIILKINKNLTIYEEEINQGNISNDNNSETLNVLDSNVFEEDDAYFENLLNKLDINTKNDNNSNNPDVNLEEKQTIDDDNIYDFDMDTFFDNPDSNNEQNPFKNSNPFDPQPKSKAEKNPFDPQPQPKSNSTEKPKNENPFAAQSKSNPTEKIENSNPFAAQPKSNPTEKIENYSQPQPKPNSTEKIENYSQSQSKSNPTEKFKNYSQSKSNSTENPANFGGKKRTIKKKSKTSIKKNKKGATNKKPIKNNKQKTVKRKYKNVKRTIARK